MAMLVATPALAQQTNAEPPAAENAGLEEILVTAQRKSENIQGVPVSIAAVSAETVSNLNLQDLKDIQFAVPNMTFGEGINYSLVNIRGVGSWGTNPGLEPGVATYIDGAYLQRGFGAVYDIVDPGSIQVLRGPQGTLWGRNSTGGAILINTANPERDFSARVAAEVGSLGHQKAEAVLNVPLGEMFAARVAVRFRNEGGYIDNPTTNKKLGWSKQSTVRVKLGFTPSSAFDAVLQYQHDRGKGGLDQNAAILPAPYCAFCGQSAYAFPLSDPYQTVINNVNGGIGANDTSDFLNLTMNYHAGDVTLTSISAYRKTDNFAAGDFDFTEVQGFNLFQASGSEAFTQTLQAVSDFDGIVNFTAGVDYLHDKSPYQLWVGSADNYSGAPANAYSVKTESISGFGEVRLNPVPELTVTAGGRYTHDKRRSFAGGLSGEVSFNSFTPRFVVAYDTGAVNLYASYNRGSKAGGYTGAPLAGNIYRPEKIDSYEIGAKYFSPDRSLRLNAAAFLYKYKDIQVVGVDQSNVGNIASANNAGSATGKGIELDGEFQPASWISLFGGIAYLDAKYDTFTGATVQVPTFDANGQPNGLAVGSEDLSGFRLPRAPRWTANFGVNLNSPLWSGWTGELTAAAHYTSSFDFDYGAGGPLRSDAEPSYTVMQLTARLQPEDERYQISFYIDNLTDTTYNNFIFTTAPFGGYRVTARPRSYGIGLTAKF